MRIESISDEQLAAALRARDTHFAAVTSCVTDRPRAEAAAAVIVAPALREYEVHWVASPDAGDSLWDSLSASLRASLSASLWASLSASLSASGHAVFSREACRIAGIEDERTARIGAVCDLLASCTAIWVLPGHVILCDAPTSCAVVDGKLVSATWAQEATS